MNILILSWRGIGHPDQGGAEISTFEHAKAWVRKGHSVTLFTSYYKDAKKEDQIHNVYILRRGSQFIGVHWSAFIWYVFKKHQNFDLVVDEFHGIPFFTPLYMGKKKLAFIHEVTKEVWKLNPWPKPFNLLPAIIGTFFEPLIFILYKKIPFMTVSDSTKKDLVSFGIPSANITVIENGVSIPKGIKKYPKENKKTLIYLGALSKDKGIEDAIKVFSYISNTKKDWQFWVVGKSDPTYMNFLKSLIDELGLENKVKSWGYVSKNKKFELLSRSHVLINPSIREGWGLVVIEAAAVGTPTIAFDVPGLRDSIINNKTGIIDKYNSPDSLAEKVINLLSDGKKYWQMKKEVVKWSKGFSWEKSASRSLNLINYLMKNNN